MAKTIPKATATFILSEANGSQSRETVTLITGQNLAAGTVLGKITASGKYTAHAPAASDGSENAIAIIYAAVDATSADKNAVIIARDSEVNLLELTWNGSITTNQKNTAIANLLTKGIIVR